MIVRDIHYNENFEKLFLFLPKKIQQKAHKTERLFLKNPFYPSLRLHKLQGKLKGIWSISIDKKYRITFKVMEDGVILFTSIGSHAIYD